MKRLFSKPLKKRQWVQGLALLSCCLVLLLGQMSPAPAQPGKAPTASAPNDGPYGWPALFRKPKPPQAVTKPKPKAKPARSTAQAPADPKSKAEPKKPAAPPAPLFAPIRSPQEQVRGVWLTLNDMVILKDQTKLATAMDDLARLNFNTVYPVVWNSGYITYPSAIAQKKGMPYVHQGNQNQDIIAEVVSQARRHNMLVIPWMEFGFMAPSTSELALEHPEWLTQKRDGSQTSNSAAGEVSWLNPFHPEVQRFLTDLAIEVVTSYDVDGIQFDDHTSLPVAFGYDDYTVKLYTQEMKKAPPADPDDPAWVRWRADKITEFMVRLKQEVRQRRPKAIFSLSPNYADYAYKFQLQDWRTWIEKGIVDELAVQVYQSDMGGYLNKLDRPEMKIAQQKIPTSIGILTGLRRRPIYIGQVQSQVQAAQERGYGAVFFYYESLWDEGPESISDRKAGFQYLFNQSAPRIIDR
jgi:uncharacterized lipoprotein YddW (UPF0748 family)